MSARRADALRLRALDIDRVAFALGTSAEQDARAARADADDQHDRLVEALGTLP